MVNKKFVSVKGMDSPGQPMALRSRKIGDSDPFFYDWCVSQACRASPTVFKSMALTAVKAISIADTFMRCKCTKKAKNYPPNLLNKVKISVPHAFLTNKSPDL